MDQFSAWSEVDRRTIPQARIIETLIIQGWAQDWRHGDRDRAVREASAALDELIALGLPHTPGADPRFDPVEVLNFLNWAGLNGLHPIRQQHTIPTSRRLILETRGLSGLQKTPPPGMPPPARYRVTLRRSFAPSGHDPDKRVRLRIPAPIDEPGQRDLLIEPLLPETGVVATRLMPGYLEIQASIPAGGQITAGIRASFTATSSPSSGSLDGPIAPLASAERELYTRPVEGMVRVTPRIRALAEHLAGSEPDTEKCVARFWTHTMQSLRIGGMHHDLITPDAPLDFILDLTITNCIGMSSLMVGLCRARQIPARLVTGYMLYPCAPGYHTWFEVWVDGKGWLPHDFLGSLTNHPHRPGLWRDYYYEKLDHRMVVERPPRLFVGSADVRLPPRWHMLVYLDEEGTVMEFRAMDSNALVYREHIMVERLGWVAGAG